MHFRSKKKWKVDPNKLCNFSKNIEPSSIIQPASASELANDFSIRLHKSATENIGKTKGVFKKRKRTVWWNIDCSKAVAERRKARKLLEKHPTHINANIYKAKAKSVDKITQKAKNDSFRKFVQEIHHDIPLGLAWKKFRALKGYNNNINNPLIHNNTVISDTKLKTEIFAEYYQDLSASPNNKSIDNFQSIISDSISSNEETYNTDIQIHEIDLVLQKVKNTSPGLDEIPYSFIKALQPENILELLSIFNQCFNTGEFPEPWKKGNIITILKPNKPKEEVSSYRPITLLSCIGKIFERILQRRLEYILEKNNKLAVSQCGFCKGLGATDILLQIENIIRDSLQDNKICLIAYIDLKSAFDTVWDDAVIFKLNNFGIKGKLLKILYDFFKNRSIKVSLGGYESEDKIISAGTPQGSVLSPILFNVMLSDLPQQEGINLHTYADDITITCVGADLKETKSRLQKYLSKLQKWSTDWNLKLNPQKCIMQYYTKRKMSYPILKIHNTVLKYEKNHKLLGLIFDAPKLHWKKHVDYLIVESNRRLDLLKALSSSVWRASANILRTFHVLYIRSKIDYGSTIYGSANQNYLKKLEVIQNKALRFILGARNTSPIISMQAEAYLPPLNLHRGYLSIKQYIKLKYKPSTSLTSTILKLNTDAEHFPFNSFTHRNKSFMTLVNLPKIIRRETDTVPVFPPWESISEYVIYDCTNDVADQAHFSNHMSNEFFDYVRVFTDGSKVSTEPMSVGCAAYFQREKSTVCWKLIPDHSVSVVPYKIYVNNDNGF